MESSSSLRKVVQEGIPPIATKTSIEITKGPGLGTMTKGAEEGKKDT
jgi:hypothetical protein